MAARKTPLIPGEFYHVFTRGNNKNHIFYAPRDYGRLIQKIGEYHVEYPIRIFAYCLMPNHLHFLVQQTEHCLLSDFFGTLLNSHARYINLKYDNVGHVFQGRFKANFVENEASFMQVSRYIHLNPLSKDILQNGFIKRGATERYFHHRFKQHILNYPWSSYRYYHYPAVQKANFLDTTLLFSISGGYKQYKQFVEANIRLSDIIDLEALNSPS